ncbi:MAG: hypothetical protein AAF203_04465, partial [Pseudomonadota bacterium]
VFLHPADKKRYDVTVVMVHHMWGNHKTTWRHYRYLNEKGFDCVSFDLVMGSNKIQWEYHPVLRYLYKGVFYVWTRQIRSVLDTIPGKKIIFSFSGPSLSSFWASEGRNDITKVICDGGPFQDVYKNSKQMFYHEVGIKNSFLNSLAAFLGTIMWGFRPLDKLYKVLRNWSVNIPILSIRGVRDPIVNLESIDRVFKPHKFLNLKILELQYGKHLDGFRDFPEQYCKALMPFLIEKTEVSKEIPIVPPPRPRR